MSQLAKSFAKNTKLFAPLWMKTTAKTKDESVNWQNFCKGQPKFIASH